MSLKELEKPYIVENLFFKVSPEKVNEFLKLDYEIWTKELSKFPFFLRKETWISKDVPGEIMTVVHWSDLEAWKNIDQEKLGKTAIIFEEKIGSETIQVFKRKYDENQYEIVNIWEKEGINFENMGEGDFKLNTLKNPYAVEELVFKVEPDYLKKFIEVDYEIWTKELSKNPSFIRKETWVSKTDPGEVRAVIYWDSYENWKNIDHHSLIETGKIFDEKIGENKYQFLDAPHDKNQFFKVNFVRK